MPLNLDQSENKGPSIYHVSKFLNLFRPNPISQHKYSTERQKKLAVF